MTGSSLLSRKKCSVRSWTCSYVHVAKRIACGRVNESDFGSSALERKRRRADGLCLYLTLNVPLGLPVEASVLTMCTWKVLLEFFLMLAPSANLGSPSVFQFSQVYLDMAVKGKLWLVLLNAREIWVTLPKGALRKRKTLIR